jgi:hypothetical protein
MDVWNWFAYQFCHHLLEKTDFLSLPSFLRKWLSENKHIKYLWIPYTDTVVVVQCNPPSRWRTPKFTSKYGKDEAIQHVRDLYHESLKKYRYYLKTICTAFNL